MEKTKYAKKTFWRHKTKNPRPNEEKNKKVIELMATYGMEEAIALEIATGFLSLDAWRSRQKEREKIMEYEKTFEKEVSQFFDSAPISLDLSIQILKGAFSLKEYKEQKVLKMEKDREAEEIARKHNIPLHIGRMVAMGKFTLEDYFKRQKQLAIRKQKAIELNAKHPEISLGSCYSIIDEGLEIEEYLKRKEQNFQKRRTWYTHYLQENSEHNKPLAIYLQKLKNKKINVFFSLSGFLAESGTVVANSPYQIVLKNGRGQTLTYPKLKIKFLCRANYAEKVLSCLQIDPNLREHPVLPSPNPYDRYKVPEEILKEGQKVKLTLGEGEILTGIVKWSSPYDIKLSISSTPKTSVLVFRHAIVLAEAASE